MKNMTFFTEENSQFGLELIQTALATFASK